MDNALAPFNMTKKADDVLRDLKAVLADLKEVTDRVRNESAVEDDSALRERFLMARANLIALVNEERNNPAPLSSPEETVEGISPEGGGAISRIALGSFLFGSKKRPEPN